MTLVSTGRGSPETESVLGIIVSARAPVLSARGIKMRGSLRTRNGRSRRVNLGHVGEPRKGRFAPRFTASNEKFDNGLPRTDERCEPQPDPGTSPRRNFWEGGKVH